MDEKNRIYVNPSLLVMVNAVQCSYKQLSFLNSNVNSKRLKYKLYFLKDSNVTEKA